MEATSTKTIARDDHGDHATSAFVRDPVVLPILIALLVFTVGLSVAGVFVLIARLYTLKLGQVRCHICHRKVSKSSWDDCSHREACAKRHENFLAALPVPFDIRCPTCLAYLKQLPKDRGRRFRCDDSDCAYRDGKIRNNGYNRLNCFKCDYDVCDSCATRRIRMAAGAPPPTLQPACQLEVIQSASCIYQPKAGYHDVGVPDYSALNPQLLRDMSSQMLPLEAAYYNNGAFRGDGGGENSSEVSPRPAITTRIDAQTQDTII